MNEAKDLQDAISLIEELRIEAHSVNNRVAWQILYRVGIALNNKARELADSFLSA